MRKSHSVPEEIHRALQSLISNPGESTLSQDRDIGNNKENKKDRTKHSKRIEKIQQRQKKTNDGKGN